MDIQKEMERIRHAAHEHMVESIGLEQDAALEGEFIHDVERAFREFNAWRNWYCKKNQPKNYIRLLCRVPKEIPVENTNLWMLRMQLFRGSLNPPRSAKLLWDIKISYHAYLILKSMNVGWEYSLRDGAEYYVYKKPVFR